MKLFPKPSPIELDGICPKFRHFLELRGFLPFVLPNDLGQRWDNWRNIAKS